ncbi:MAG: hypothetical protein AAF804_09270 [Bacteroidota bacterium]
MKSITLIWSIYVLCLAGLPALGMMGILPELACCIDHHDEHQKDEGGECRDACNPFLFCHCCSGFTTVTTDHTFTLDRISPRNSRVEHLLPNQVVSCVWRPPQV